MCVCVCVCVRACVRVCVCVRASHVCVGGGGGGGAQCLVTNLCMFILCDLMSVVSGV